MKIFSHCLALLFMMPASAFATFKFCDIYQGQLMQCSEVIAIASNIPVYRDDGYRHCYIQAGSAIYCETLASVRKFPVLTEEGYRDCDIDAGVVTSCTTYSNATHFVVDLHDEDPRVWMRWLKSAWCMLPSAWQSDGCAAHPHLPQQITFF